MGEFVEIRTSPAEIINIAHGLREKGEALQKAAQRHNHDIEKREEPHDVFPAGDEFVEGFHPDYIGPTTDVNGHGSTTNAALRAAAEFCGKQLIDIGNYVASAMATYDVADQQAGADITKAGQHGHK
ncbi:hypothetical protein [Actinoplanes sp. L3-i22]|uniref:hypothetical protein n=1 Tax=Actinoplanes sp. L3-i22 TaxID=2836373 RepID=UPI001C768643|nr:hypothetical protein [Actinoplanes sp. L3-i22]BCY06439.1 hypothetical protein L3i22_015270 [Actinoplanes sp. L3-i22]